ncbi:20672_t:CDS:2 [Entrophospora sp. SA101]|nr:8033_t:CDS:2 [Entrophospora sp. SA101]CAJ0630452.1 3319_t:CDS:2 [Entrophospora sp. SA101]CAJ0765737.1 20672_t:CDS:2 [Entrophospora sp. SA101]CAJ0850797.1 15766_t:CDS:2 [Entrophospora sp. SA101]CAJ0899915.1 13718_t:CDS:2 [Entrophospora sp. SA101]
MLILYANNSPKLEQLPFELLELIFILSRNPLFTQVSKKIHQLFKPTLSLKVRWLMNISNGNYLKALRRGIRFNFFDKELLFHLDALYLQQYLKNNHHENSLPPTFIPYKNQLIPHRFFSLPDPEGKLIELTKILLDRKASPDEPDGYPIIKSVAVGKEDMIKLLLEYGANPNVKSGAAITICVKSNRFSIINLLIENGGKPSAKDVNIAIKNGNWHLAEYLILLPATL